MKEQVVHLMPLLQIVQACCRAGIAWSTLSNSTGKACVNASLSSNTSRKREVKEW